MIRTIGDALTETEKPFLITSGTALFSNEKIVTEKKVYADNPHPRIETENAADEVALKGVKVAVIRLSPSVHEKGDVIGFIPTMINIIEKAKEKLSITTLSVGEIAYELRFEHSQSFSKLFKTKTNLSPLEFRQSFN